jgi:hypothetical protein
MDLLYVGVVILSGVIVLNIVISLIRIKLRRKLSKRSPWGPPIGVTVDDEHIWIVLESTVIHRIPKSSIPDSVYTHPSEQGGRDG